VTLAAAAKLHLAVLFGGRSCEHEVSVTSAKSLLEGGAIPESKCDLTLVGISRGGRWFLVEEPAAVFAAGRVEDDCGLPLVMLDHCGGRRLVAAGGAGGGEGDGLHYRPLDVVFPLLHGPGGEDGTVQGLLALAGIACVGSGVGGSAAAMDKETAKLLCAAANLPQTEYRTVRHWQWRDSADEAVADLAALGRPLFVKPANMGSSVGVRKVDGEAELRGALEFAFQFDLKVIVERAAEGFREIECSVLGNDRPRASVAGEIVPGREFYDYETKYLDGKSQLLIPAPVAAGTQRRIQQLSLQVFQAVGAEGMARVDFFLSRDEQTLLVNEINTIPGFTPISMYPKLWQASGLHYGELVEELLRLAMQRRRRRDQLQVKINLV